MQPDDPLRRSWTVMVYMAGDNGRIFETAHGRIKLMAEMTSAGYHDLMEMSSVGSTRQVAVTCLFDSLEGSFIIEVRRGQGLSDSIVKPLREVNTGDPATLSAFIVRSMQDYPAEHYMLVLWNHGTGWLDVDHYAAVRSWREPMERQRPLFRTTLRALVDSEPTRPIAYDDASMDFLDSADLRMAFSDAQARTGRRLDVVGMDACLMAMIEGARELAPFADYFVASQEVEPMSGWPYDALLRDMDSHPEMRPADLAETIVTRYAQFYGGSTRAEQKVTQSAIDLSRSATTAARCKALVDAILQAGDPSLRSLVRDARDEAIAFEGATYRDLGDFAAILVAKAGWSAPGQGCVAEAASALRANLEERGTSGPVLRVGYQPIDTRTTGLSVFLPDHGLLRPDILDSYRRLAFARTTGWDRLLEWLYLTD